ncbi:MAG: cell division transport system permease protein [Patescibacteria group bacterium]|nr:cell division transport system permease protein [Patescibacteria group bacterium]
MIAFFRAFAQSWRQLLRSGWLWAATLIVFLLAFFSVNTLLATHALVDQVLREAGSRVDVSVTFKPGTPSAIVEQARSYWVSLPETSSVEVVSADQALEEFRARFQHSDDVQRALQEVGTNPLGARITLQAKTLKDYDVLTAALQAPVYQEWIEGPFVLDHARAIHELEQFRRAVQIVGSLLLAVFVGVALLLVFNAVRMAIFTQKDEILIMRLVGAPKWRIRLPYVLSVVWLVSIAGILMSLGGVGVYRWLLPQTQGWAREGVMAIGGMYQSSGLLLMTVQVVVGAVLCGGVAYIATGKYVKR